LLVRTQDWRRACEALDRHGFARRLPEPRPGFDERFGKAASHAAEDGTVVDLHRTLVVGPFGLWMNAEELFDRSTPFALGGVVLLRLDDTSQLIHACLHATLGCWPPLLMPLRDVVQVAGAGTVDWAAVEDIAGRWRVAVVVQESLAQASELFNVELP